VTCGLGGRAGLLEVLGKDPVGLVWKVSHRSMVCSRKNVRTEVRTQDRVQVDGNGVPDVERSKLGELVSQIPS